MHDRLGYTLTCLSICRALVGVTHGPIRQKDEIESGRRQWSEPIASIRFADWLSILQVERDPSQSPTMHSAATRGPYSPKSQNRVRSMPLERPVRPTALCWLGMSVSDIPRRVARLLEPHGRHTRPYLPKRRKRVRSTPMERVHSIHPLC